jgi:hypothetical protein
VGRRTPSVREEDEAGVLGEIPLEEGERSNEDGEEEEEGQRRRGKGNGINVYPTSLEDPKHT